MKINFTDRLILYFLHYRNVFTTNKITFYKFINFLLNINKNFMLLNIIIKKLINNNHELILSKNLFDDFYD